jgi:hypothetical protein
MKLSKAIAKAGCDEVLLTLSENEELNFGD